MQEKICIGSV